MGVSFMHKSEDHGIDDFEPIITFMKIHNFVKEIRVHYKPDIHAEEETYEKYLIHLLSRGPIAVSFKSFPSYSLDDPGSRILSPTALELARSAYEYNYNQHVVLLMGPGADLEGNEFWELYETSGKNWGDCGFVRLAMHQGLIEYAVEMEI